MRTLLWDDRYSIGIKSIDDDHMKFFELIGLLDCMENYEEVLVESCFNVLTEYVHGHFHREELAMEKSKLIPEVERINHKKQHDAFKETLMDVISEYDGGNLSIVDKMPKMVVDWLINHITKEDIKSKNWLLPEHVDGSSLAGLSMKCMRK